MPPETPPPLQGVRVLDLSRLLPGPACSWYLQGLGAEVIRIEDPRYPDDLRAFPAWFEAINAHKRSIQLDLRDPVGQDHLHRLLSTADVLLESARPGALGRLGLAPLALRARHPHLILCSITGYGQTGPLRDLPGHDLNYCGLAGALSLAARHEGVPDVPGLQVADLAGGALTAALRIVAALFARQKTGQGDWLDVSLTEGVMALLAPELAAAAQGQASLPGQGLLTGALSRYRVYRCADGGLVAVGALEERFWQALAAALGLADLPREEAALVALFASRERAVWVDLLGEGCVTPVLELGEVAAHPQHQARGMFGPEGRVRPPFPGAQAGGRAPMLGEHTAAVLAEIQESGPVRGEGEGR